MIWNNGYGLFADSTLSAVTASQHVCYVMLLLLLMELTMLYGPVVSLALLDPIPRQVCATHSSRQCVSSMAMSQMLCRCKC